MDAEKNLTDDYVSNEKLKDKTLEKIKEEYKFDEIKDAFDEGKIPSQLDFFFFVVTMIVFYRLVIFCP